MDPTESVLQPNHFNDTALILKLIDDGKLDLNATIKVCSNKSESILSTAVLRNKVLARQLLARGANVDVQDSDGKTSLIKAVLHKDLEAVQLLIRYEADPLIQDSDECKAFTYAAYDYSWLYRHDIEDLNEEQIHAQSVKVEMILKLVLESGCRLTGTTRPRLIYRQYFQLYRAIFENDVAAARQIIDNLEDVDFDEVKIYQPSIFAGWMGHKEILRLLVNRGTKMEKIFTTMYEHRNARDLELVKIFLDSGFDAVNFKNSRGQTLMHLACHFGHGELVKHLLLTWPNTDLEAEDASGQTIMQTACKHARIVDLLLTYGRYEVNAIDKRGQTPLHYVDHQCDAFAVFLEHGANIAIANSAGEYPKHYCHVHHSACDVVNYYKKVNLIDSVYADEMILKLFSSLELWNQIKFQNVAYYAAELENLKRIKISERTFANPPLALYGILLLDPNNAARYSRNINVWAIYERSLRDFRNKYPHYGFLLNYQLRRGSERRRLVKSTQRLLDFAMGVSTNQEITDEIVRHFGEKELAKFATDF